MKWTENVKLYTAYLLACREESLGFFKSCIQLKSIEYLFILKAQQDLAPIHLVALMHCQNINCKSVKAGNEN